MLQLPIRKFGNYIVNVGRDFAGKIPKPNRNVDDYLKAMRRNTQSLFLSPVAKIEIARLIENLTNKSSSGYDSMMLKTIKNTILEPLSLLFNQSLEEGTFPEIFKLAEVIPLNKGKSRIEVTNYRPISLLLTISKILEKIVHARTYEFLNVTNQLTGWIQCEILTTLPILSS